MAGSTPIREITRQIFKAVKGLKPQIQEARQAEAKAFALPGEIMREFEQRRAAGEFAPEGSGIIGTGFTGIDPISQLGIGIGRVGQQFGIADTFNESLGLQRARLDQIIQDIFEENRFRQQLAATRAAGRGGSGIGGVDLSNLFPKPLTPQQQILTGSQAGQVGTSGGIGAVAQMLARRQASPTGQIQRFGEGVAGLFNRLFPGAGVTGRSAPWQVQSGIGGSLLQTGIPLLKKFLPGIFR